jgi:DNA-binding transcriptional ArsR family regulator
MSSKRRKPKGGAVGKSEPGPIQQALMRALNHPVRVQALTILTEKVASPKEIAEEIDLQLSNVSYHVRRLEELGLIEIVEEEAVRGSVAHFYKAIEQSPIDNADWKKLSTRTRNAISGHILETFISDAANSLAARVFDERDDRHASRTPLLLDEKGWRKVVAIQEKALTDTLKEQAAAAGRLNGSDSEGVRAVLGMFFFELG